MTKNKLGEYVRKHFLLIIVVACLLWVLLKPKQDGFSADLYKGGGKNANGTRCSLGNDDHCASGFCNQISKGDGGAPYHAYGECQDRRPYKEECRKLGCGNEHYCSGGKCHPKHLSRRLRPTLALHFQ